MCQQRRVNEAINAVKHAEPSHELSAYCLHPPSLKQLVKQQHKHTMAITECGPRASRADSVLRYLDH